jgi:hypothetical protein
MNLNFFPHQIEVHNMSTCFGCSAMLVESRHILHIGSFSTKIYVCPFKSWFIL